jgi:hypothetical protein
VLRSVDSRRWFWRHGECLCEIAAATAGLFRDQQQRMMIDSLISLFLYGFVKGKATAAKLWAAKVCGTIRDLGVNSVGAETQAARLFARIAAVLSLSPDSLEPSLAKIRAIHDFLAFRPFVRYGCTTATSFTDFDSGDFPLGVVDFCFRRDLAAVCTALSIPESVFFCTRHPLLLPESVFFRL